MIPTPRTVPPPSIAIQHDGIRARAHALRSAIDHVIRLSASSDDDQNARMKEARRLIQLAEELYERANALVRQAEELLPPDDDTPEGTDA